MKVSVVSDTSSLIIFSKLKRLDLLTHSFDQLIIPYRVQQEVLAKEDELAEFISSNPFFKARKCNNKELLETLDGILDYGEAEAITLASELGHRLLIDEKKGRMIALGMKIKIIGFLGVLLLNNKQGKLSRVEAIDLVEQAKLHKFRLSSQLEKRFTELLKNK